MSVSMLHEAVRITDRFYGIGDVEAMDRQGRLQNCIILVFIFHMMMVITFLKLEELEKARPRIIKDVNVAFEFIPPPPPPPPQVKEKPKVLSLTAGDLPQPGSEAAPKPLPSDAVEMPAIKAPTVEPVPEPVPAKPVPSRRTTQAPPVALTPTNVIESRFQAPSQLQTKPREMPAEHIPVIAGNPAERPLSGATRQGGAPDGDAAGTGTGGIGTGGTGQGAGDRGAGAGFGDAGGIPIATRLPVAATRAMGNIAPYRKDLLMRIARNWQPQTKSIDLIVLLTLDHDGNLLGSRIFKSSGKKKEDKLALKAIQATAFAALPDWYKGDQLTFKVQLSKAEDNQ